MAANDGISASVEYVRMTRLANPIRTPRPLMRLPARLLAGSPLPLHRSVAASVVTTFVVLWLGAPLAVAGGTPPESGEGEDGGTVYQQTYYTGLLQQSVLRVDKLDENVAGRDYYNVANTMHQLSSDAWYDFPNFWTYFGEALGPFPDESDWDPGITHVGPDGIPFDISVTAGEDGFSFTASLEWIHEWGGQWDIADRNAWTSGDWNFRYHQEWFHNDYCWGCSRLHDWDHLTHGTTWGATEGRAHGLYVKSTIKYCTGGMDCWKGVHSWDESPWIWVPLNDQTQGGEAADCNVDLGGGADNAFAAVGDCVDTNALNGLPLSQVPGAPSPVSLVVRWDPADLECGREILFPDCDPSTAAESFLIA